MAASNTSFELRSETFCTKHLRRRRRAKLIAQSTNTDGCCVLRRSRCAEGHVQNLNRAFLEGKCSSACPAIVRPPRGDVRKAAACGLSRGQGPPGPLSSREVIIGNRAGSERPAPGLCCRIADYAFTAYGSQILILRVSGIWNKLSTKHIAGTAIG